MQCNVSGVDASRTNGMQDVGRFIMPVTIWLLTLIGSAKTRYESIER